MNNDNVFLKGTYFKSTGAGSHNVTFGYDGFNDKLTADNRQSATDYRTSGTTATLIDDDDLPRDRPTGTLIVHRPSRSAAKAPTFGRTRFS